MRLFGGCPVQREHFDKLLRVVLDGERIEEIFAQTRQRSEGWHNLLVAPLFSKRRDGRKMIDGFLKRKKDLLIALVVIEVNDDFRNLWDQPLQNLALHRGEIEEAIEHEQLHIGKHRAFPISPIEFTVENR